MSENEETESQATGSDGETSNQTDTSQDTPVQTGAASDLLATVAAQIASSNDVVREKVIASLVDKEIEDRVSLLRNALDNRKKQENELRRIKPDVKVVDAKGATISQGYSPGEQKKLKEAQEHYDKSNAILEAALAKGDFSKLKNK